MTNDEVLSKANAMDIEVILSKIQLRWAGHIAGMPDNRLSPNKYSLESLVKEKDLSPTITMERYAAEHS